MASEEDKTPNIVPVGPLPEALGKIIAAAAEDVAGKAPVESGPADENGQTDRYAAIPNEPIELDAPHKHGKPKKYFVHDLLAAWQGLLDEGVDLPPLLPSYQQAPRTYGERPR